MGEEINERLEQIQDEVSAIESENAETTEDTSVADTVTTEVETDEQKTPKEKMSKKKLGIIVAIAAILVIALAIVLIPSKFKRVENECLRIAGQIGTGKNYFSLDTDPYENMNETVRALLQPSHQEKTLEAIRYANNELGFPGSVYSDMLKTSALMGRQSEENNKYKVSWTYHPDHGLEVTYTKK